MTIGEVRVVRQLGLTICSHLVAKFTHLDMLKDSVARENIHLIPYVLEWGYAYIILRNHCNLK